MKMDMRITTPQGSGAGWVGEQGYKKSQKKIRKDCDEPCFYAVKSCIENLDEYGITLCYFGSALALLSFGFVTFYILEIRYRVA